MAFDASKLIQKCQLEPSMKLFDFHKNRPDISSKRKVVIKLPSLNVAVWSAVTALTFESRIRNSIKPKRAMQIP